MMNPARKQKKTVRVFADNECSSLDELLKVAYQNSPLIQSSIVSWHTSNSNSDSNASKGSNSSSESSVSSDNMSYFKKVMTIAKESNAIALSDSSSTQNGTYVSDVHKELKRKNGIPHNSKFDKGPNKYLLLHSYTSDGKEIAIQHTLTSRQGNDKQRFERHANNSKLLIRLTAGCIPITNDGRIICCSSSKKKEWIFPKGGWEDDESMEESAAREAYEEAGLLGTLGPKIIDIMFETKKKKLDEEQQKIKEDLDQTQSMRDDNMMDSCMNEKCNVSTEDICTRSLETSVCIENYDSLPSKHAGVEWGLVKVSFFPLYVSEVLEEWPESARSRKIFTIDEALVAIKRDELRKVLYELKKTGLHLAHTNVETFTTNLVEL